MMIKSLEKRIIILSSCIFLAIFTILSLSPAFGGTEEFCAAEWPNDYKMRDYCIRQQSNANQELFNLAEKYGLIKNGTIAPSLSGSDIEKMLLKCMQEWKKARFDTYDFKMVVYCWKQQIDSYESIGGNKGEETGTQGFCANEWPNDFKMQKYCQGQQNQGNQELFALARSYDLLKDGKLSVSPSGSAIERIFYKCMSEWQKRQFKTYDYKMVVYCIKQQIKYLK